MNNTRYDPSTSRLSYMAQKIKASNRNAGRYKGYSSINSNKMISIYCNSNRKQMERSLSPKLMKKIYPKGSPYRDMSADKRMNESQSHLISQE